MSEFHYDAPRTGLLLVDPYNDFLSEGGKLWPMMKDVTDEVSLLDHLRSILAAARAAGIRVFFVPHRRWEPGDYEDWDHPNPSQHWGKSGRSSQREPRAGRVAPGSELGPALMPITNGMLTRRAQRTVLSKREIETSTLYQRVYCQTG